MMSTFPHSRRKSTLKTVLLWGLLMVPASALLYSTSAHVRELQKDLAQVDARIAEEKEALRVLNAEWAYLNNPQRLATRARTYLGFKTLTSSKQIARLNDMSAKVALRSELAPGETVASAPAVPVLHTANAATQPASPLSTRLRAQPITYTAQLVDDLPEAADARMPAAAGWSDDKVVGMNSLSPESAKDRRIP